MVTVAGSVAELTTSDSHWVLGSSSEAPRVTDGRGLVTWMPPPSIDVPAAVPAVRRWPRPRFIIVDIYLRIGKVNVHDLRRENPSHYCELADIPVLLAVSAV